MKKQQDCGAIAAAREVLRSKIGLAGASRHSNPLAYEMATSSMCSSTTRVFRLKPEPADKPS